MNGEKREWLETFIGGGFGIIAIAAAIAEYALEEGGELAGCIKDISGTLIIVVILFAAIKIKPRNITGKLRDAVTNWGNSNIPLIFKMTEDGEGHYKNSYALLTDHLKYIDLLSYDTKPGNTVWDKYRNPSSHDTGRFLELPEFQTMTTGDFEVVVHMEQDHFKEIDEKTIQTMLNRLSNISEIIDTVNEVPKSKKAIVKFKSIKTTDDIEQFIIALNYLLSVVTVIL